MIPERMLEDLIRRTGFTSSHAGTLLELGQHMKPLASEIALAFYDYLGRDPEMHAILWAVPGRVERLYQSFATWYQELFCGEYGSRYAHRRVRIGLVHARVGVRPGFLVPAMGVVQELSLEHLRNTLRGPRVFSAIEAFEKIISIELAMMQESYMLAREEGLRLGVVSNGEATMEGAKVLLEKN